MRHSSDPTPIPDRRLRLAGEGDPTPRRPSSAHDARARSDRLRAGRRAHREWEIGAENRAAAGLAGFDARWIMATRVSDALEGGRGAILRPEARTRLLSTAGRMGLRPFDTNMVIAIVQDAARRGEPTLGADTADRLALVGPAQQPERPRHALLLLLSTALAVLWGALLLRWLLS